MLHTSTPNLTLHQNPNNYAKRRKERNLPRFSLLFGMSSTGKRCQVLRTTNFPGPQKVFTCILIKLKLKCHRFHSSWVWVQKNFPSLPANSIKHNPQNNCNITDMHNPIKNAFLRCFSKVHIHIRNILKGRCKGYDATEIWHIHHACTAQCSVQNSEISWGCKKEQHWTCFRVQKERINWHQATPLSVPQRYMAHTDRLKRKFPTYFQLISKCAEGRIR